MSFLRRGIYFDKQDRDILMLVNRILESDNKPSDNSLFDPSLHPHGIKELVAIQDEAITSAMKPAEGKDLQKLAEFFGKR